MSDVMTQQLVQSLKGYFKKEEFSDKVLHIIELDDIETSISRKRKTNTEDEITTALKKPSPALPNHLLSSTPVLSTKKRKSPLKALKYPLKFQVDKESNSDNDDNCTSSELIEESMEETFSNDTRKPEDNGQKKIFSDLTFYVSKNVNVEFVTKKIKENEGFIGTQKSSDFIINNYAVRKKCDTRERTVKWLLDSIKDLEIKPSFLDVLYRPVVIKNRPLAGCIATIDKEFSTEEKNVLLKLCEALGASTQELVFKRDIDNSMFASTHLIVKDAPFGVQYDTAQEWDIPCVREEWLLQCIATDSLHPVDEFIMQKSRIEDDEVDTREMTYGNETRAYSVIPVHSLVLCINSPYFKTLIADSGMKETKLKDIVVKVNKGEGKYLEMLIKSFYDQDSLKELDAFDLLKVLEIADRFLCDVFIKRGLTMLKKLNLGSIEQCNKILERILLFESSGSSFTNDNCGQMKQFCAKFLSDLFVPLETRLDKHEEFEKLSIEALLVLLQSKKTFLWSENSLMYFIVNWFAADEARQSEENIEAILKEVHYEQLTPEFMGDVLSLTHTILSKWKGFTQWYTEALMYHALSVRSKKSREFPAARKSRSYNSHKYDIQNCMIKLSYVADGMFKQSWSNYRNIVFQGYVITPVIVISDSDEENKYKVKLNLYLGSSCNEKEIPQFNLEFNVAFALFPGNESYDASDIFSVSGSVFLNKHYRPINVNFKHQNFAKFHVGTVDGLLFQRFQNHGILSAFAFKSNEVAYWPQFMRSFRDDENFETYNRTATQNFAFFG